MQLSMDMRRRLCCLNRLQLLKQNRLQSRVSFSFAPRRKEQGPALALCLWNLHLRANIWLVELGISDAEQDT